MPTLELPAQTEDVSTASQDAAWLAARRLGIGGSDASAALSEGHGCPRALFYDKSGVDRDFEHSEDEKALFERGHAFEPLVLRGFADDMGLSFGHIPAQVSVERPWMRVNVDARLDPVSEGHALYGSVEGPGYLEGKTANEEVFYNMLQEGMPAGYVLQMQHGLSVTGWTWGFFAVRALPSWRKLYVPVKRDERLIEVLNEVEDAFWKRVKSGDIPDRLEDFADQRCSGCGWRRTCRSAEALPSKPKRKKVYELDASSDVDVLVGNIKTLDAQIAEAEELKSAERRKLQILMGDRTGILVPGQGKKVLYDWRSGSLRLDVDALKAELPEIAEKYSWRGAPTRVMTMYDVAEVPGLTEVGGR